MRLSGSRRSFLGAGVAGGLLTLEELGFLRRLPPVSAADMELPADAVRFSPDIEPLVQLLEETPRGKVVETFAARVRAGTSYREVLAALLLAGVRNVQPRPSVGFKFHAVLVVNSAHLASLAASESDRWLPIFWALDYFKSSQARDVQEGDWTMAAVDESRMPPPHRARQAFQQAMDAWDEEAADAAVSALCRSASAHEVFDLMAHYGCRDYRSIGHKAIYVANAYRTLQCIGWRYAEPVLRSLAYALLNHTGEPNPAASDLEPDRAWRVTQTAIESLGRPGTGRIDAGATRELLDTWRTCTPQEAVDATARMLQGGIAAQSISDALFLSAGEMLEQQPGIISLHSATATNALQYAYRTAYRRRTRWELLLQNAAFIPHFRQSMQSRGRVRETRIELDREPDEQGQPPTVEEIFRAASQDRAHAARAMRQYLEAGGQAETLIDSARRLVFVKGNDAHDYKFSSAVLEDYYALSPQFRAPFLSNAAYLLPSPDDPDNGLVAQIQQALA
ncbi:MAG: hypothetical protein D6753_17510 [Planctomycetota bacterium]|nr:MAG: hypothetical protein D6753_17510 [Planctomycetota bacterium]